MSKQRRASDEINDAILGAIRAVEKERGGLRGWKGEAAERLGLKHYQVSKILTNDDKGDTLAVGVATARKIALRAMTWDTDEKRRKVWRSLAEVRRHQAPPGSTLATALYQEPAPVLAVAVGQLEAAVAAGDMKAIKAATEIISAAVNTKIAAKLALLAKPRCWKCGEPLDVLGYCPSEDI